ncbi:Copper homeostasis CutC domain protein [Beauveria brongniartii RCEF 3172]|uniref:Copper homeostasis protein cutC homolog n=1 Tax=Beauveria brongniartii RCEF 3172 TaxID=1081107 RepID=A0A162JPM1_9HYPO|nr:Copper homeostasis CutC domain protein [Beauveria brongniartii RCEF 3172]
MAKPLEVAVFNTSDALNASHHGAARVEINAPDSYALGGLTPAASDLPTPSDLPHPVRVMIRPRGPPPSGPDFLYAPAEIDAMRADIARLAPVMHASRGDGFVFGVLKRREEDDDDDDDDDDLEVDVETCAELVRLARPFDCTFHRAFDSVRDVDEGVEALIRCGFAGVLTAGGQAEGGCAANLDRLESICDRVAGRIEVVAGGGVRHHNAQALAARLARYKRVWLHTAAMGVEGTMNKDELIRLTEGLVTT